MFQTTNQNIMWIWLFLLISLGKKTGKIKSLAIKIKMRSYPQRTGSEPTKTWI